MATKVEKLEFEGSQYEVIPPLPTSTERGGVIASAKTSDYTTEVKLGSDGKLYVPEGNGVKSLSDLGITASASRLNKTAAYFRNDDKTITDIETAGAVYVTSLDDSKTMPIVASEFQTSSGHKLTNKVNCQNYLAAGADLNTVTTTGVYRLESGHVNAPNDGDHGYGQMFVGHGGGDTIFQMIVSFGTAKVFVRAGNPSDVGGVGSWTTWKTLDTPFRDVFNNGNLDELKTAGMYWLQILADVTGTKPMPDGNFGYLEIVKVVANSSDCMQRFTDYYHGDIYTRVYVNGGWQPWKQTPNLHRGSAISPDFNHLAKTGVYWVYTGDSANKPSGCDDYGFVEVFLTDYNYGNAVQRFTGWSTGGTFVRVCVNNGWSQWFKIGGGAGSWQTWTSGTLLTNYTDISIRVRVDSDARPSGTYVVVNIPTAMLSTATAQDDYFSMTVVTQGGTWEDNCFWGTLYVKVNAANNGITVTIDGLAHRLNGSPIIKVR